MKKFILTIVIMLTVGCINAQEIMQVHMANGRSIKVPVTKIDSISFDTLNTHSNTLTGQLEILKGKIVDCNDMLGNNYDVSYFNTVNKSLVRLVQLCLNCDSITSRLQDKSDSLAEENKVELDTVETGHFSTLRNQLMSLGYHYATFYKFPNMHFDYDAETKTWTITDETPDIQINYQEADGLKTTISVTPMSDKYVSTANGQILKNSESLISNCFYDVLVCSHYNVKIVRGDKTLLSGEVIHGVSNTDDKFSDTGSTEMNLDINDYHFSFVKTTAGENGMQPVKLSFTKDTQNLLTVNYDILRSKTSAQNSDMKNFSVDLFGKIQLKGEINNVSNIGSYLHSAFATRDSSELALYADSLNNNIKIGLYYDGNDKIVANNQLYVGQLIGNSYFLLPELKFVGQSEYVTFGKLLTGLTLDDIDGVYNLYLSINRDMIVNAVELVSQIYKVVKEYYKPSSDF